LNQAASARSPPAFTKKELLENSDRLSDTLAILADEIEFEVSEKRRIVELTLEPDASVAEVARAHGMNANQVFK
jgi:hypothetical protein